MSDRSNNVTIAIRVAGLAVVREAIAVAKSIAAHVRKVPPMPFVRGEYYLRWVSDCDGTLSRWYIFDFDLEPPTHINCRCVLAAGSNEVTP